jgi:DtxR family Mn-dependent transcriptional regulator
MSKGVEEYLEALYTLTQNGAAVSTHEVAERLKVAPASVTEMFKKLSEKGYVIYSPYQGVVLTDEGYRYGRKMARKHRILERFLHDVLSIKKDHVHEQACEMEHSLSDEIERSMCKILGQPQKCPDDGQAIPPCDFKFSNCQECRNSETNCLEEMERRKEKLVPLRSLKDNETGKVAFIQGGRQVVQRLLDLGLTNGTEIRLVRAAPMRGPVQVEVRGSCLAIGRGIADKVYVEAAH